VAHVETLVLEVVSKHTHKDNNKLGKESQKASERKTRRRETVAGARLSAWCALPRSGGLTVSCVVSPSCARVRRGSLRRRERVRAWLSSSLQAKAKNARPKDQGGYQRTFFQWWRKKQL
jgi:hypothetical protein